MLKLICFYRNAQAKPEADYEAHTQTPTSSVKGKIFKTQSYCVDSTEDHKEVEDKLRKNRESACRSRLKRKVMVQHMEQEYEQLKKDHVKMQQNVGY